MAVAVRSDVPGAQAASAIRASVRELDPQLAVHNPETTIDRIARSAAQPRFNATLVSAFAAVAAFLAALGIYGVLAYLVSQRRQEVGIRIALGAGQASVVGLFVRRGLLVTSIGLAAGLAGALVVSRWLASLMFDVSARDPLTFAAAAAISGAVALASSYIPAVRATRIDPLTALRSE
jgi:putative ABC transport system permease protein